MQNPNVNDFYTNTRLEIEVCLVICYKILPRCPGHQDFSQQNKPRCTYRIRIKEIEKAGGHTEWGKKKKTVGIEKLTKPHPLLVNSWPTILNLHWFDRKSSTYGLSSTTAATPPFAGPRWSAVAYSSGDPRGTSLDFGIPISSKYLSAKEPTWYPIGSSVSFKLSIPLIGEYNCCTVRMEVKLAV